MATTLRPYADADLALTLALETDPVAMAELGGPRSREALERVHLIRMRQPLAFVIEAAGDPVGTIFAWAGEHDGGPIHEVGWMVLPRAQGRGHATAGLQLMIDRIRPATDIDRLHAFPGATNAASTRLCDRFGFADLGEVEVDFGEHLLRARHRVLELSDRAA